MGFPGGIGAAFYELAVMLEKNNFQIDILYCPIGNEFKSEDKKNKIALEFARKNIKLQFFEANIWVNEPITYEKKSYAISYIIGDDSKTLSDTDIDKMMNKLIDTLTKEHQAILRN